MAVMDRRRNPRTELAAPCTLKRRLGSPISCETVDVGTGGMCVCSRRPLSPDEVLTFEFEGITGRVRVLRQQGHELYALRFERLPEAAHEHLQQLIAR